MESEVLMEQLRQYARYLRISFTASTTKEQFIDLMSVEVKGRRLKLSTDSQFQLACKFGLLIDHQLLHKDYVDRWNKKAIKEEGEAQLSANPALKKDNIIVYKGILYRITHIGINTYGWSAWLSDIRKSSDQNNRTTRLHLLANVREATPKEIKEFP